MKREMKLLAVAIAAAMLGACAGGGGETFSGPGSLAPANPAFAEEKARAAQCYANPTQACLIYELMFGQECKFLGPYCTASALLWEKFPPDESNTSTLPNGIEDASNPDTGDRTGQTIDYAVPFSSWDVAFYDVGVTTDGLGTMVQVRQSASADQISLSGWSEAYAGTARLVYEPSGQLRELRISTRSYAPRQELADRYGRPGIDAAWSTTTLQQTAFSAVTTDGVAMVANPYDSGWNYQSFGVWTEPGVPSSDYLREDVRALSFGAATSGPAIPNSGSATFTGKLAGMFVTSQGDFATADLSVHVDFAARSLNLASTGTMVRNQLAAGIPSAILDVNGGLRYVPGLTPSPGLDVSGTLTYAPGSGRFSGTLVNAAGTMSGTSNGQFYGPAAQELGGEFVLKSPTNAETFTGAYGAKR